MKTKVITISREFGSGGRTIGKLLAKDLNWKFYDKELVNKISEQSNFAKDFIEKRGEYASSKSEFLYSLLENFGTTNGGQSINDKLYITQANIIKELAQEGHCIIVGRCANHILRPRDDVFNIFIHADDEFKSQRIIRLYGETEKTAISRLKDKDRRRAVYYKYYTGEKWGQIDNYDLALNSGKIGIDACVDLIARLIKNI